LGLLHELVPAAKTIGFLTGWTQPTPDNGVMVGAQTLGLNLIVFQARSDRDFGPAFRKFAEHQARALVVNNIVFFSSNIDGIVALAERYSIPAMYPGVAYVRRGGLISYGTDVVAPYRQAAAQYVGPILKGTKPACLPVQQPTKFELAINLKTAKALGLTVPRTLLAAAAEVIE